MNKYEAIYIIDAAMEEGARSELIARFNELIANNGGQLEKVDEWGKRRLAYTIDYKNEGYYVLLHFTADAGLPREFERNLQNNENILRYLIVKLEQKRSSVKPRAVPLRPVYSAPEAEPVAPAAPVVAAPAIAVAVGAAVGVAVETAVEAAAETVAEEAPVAEAPVAEAVQVEETAEEA